MKIINRLANENQRVLQNSGVWAQLSEPDVLQIIQRKISDARKTLFMSLMFLSQSQKKIKNGMTATKMTCMIGVVTRGSTFYSLIPRIIQALQGRLVVVKLCAEENFSKYYMMDCPRRRRMD